MNSRNIIKIFSVFLLLFLCATYSADAYVKKESSYTSKNGNVYKYKWHEDSKGNKWTTWSVNGENQTNYNGWVEPGPGPRLNNPDDDNEAAKPVEDQILDVHLSYDSPYSVLYGINNPPDDGTGVKVEVVDISTGLTVNELTVNDGQVSINTSNTTSQKPFAIISTTQEGVVDVKTVIVHENSLSIATEPNK